MYVSLNFPFYDKLIYAGIVIGSYLRYNPLEDKCFDDITITTFCFLIMFKQIDLLLSGVCTVIDHKRHQVVVH